MATATKTSFNFSLEPLPFSTLCVTRIALFADSDDYDELEVSEAASRLLGRPVFAEFVDSEGQAAIYHAHALDDVRHLQP
jgi:hypothetical protein